jgi:NTP pyrophosphatase (non-canonical NTP hydrolase)
MSKVNYEDMVAALVKPGEDILKSLSPEECHILHMVVGISGEAGELLDAIKKNVIYRKPLDRENVIEEVGDVLFYLTGLCQAVGVTVEECKAENIKKLSKRYEGLTYSNEAAITRADKQ